MLRRRDRAVVGDNLTHLFTLQPDAGLTGALAGALDELGQGVETHEGDKSKGARKHGLAVAGIASDGLGNVEPDFRSADIFPLPVASNGGVLDGEEGWLKSIARADGR